jgi:phosphomannomutase
MHICKSQTRFYFRAAGVEGEPVNLSLLMVFFIARGFATWLSRKLEVPTASLRVSIGMDSRISGFAVRRVLAYL